MLKITVIRPSVVSMCYKRSDVTIAVSPVLHKKRRGLREIYLSRHLRLRLTAVPGTFRSFRSLRGRELGLPNSLPLAALLRRAKISPRNSPWLGLPDPTGVTTLVLQFRNPLNGEIYGQLPSGWI